jgi:hypothetical protein
MDEMCSKNVENKKCLQNLSENSKGKEHLGNKTSIGRYY